ncbi:hypothetical protein BB560_003998, partial [Smittium megazygosporum]
LFFIEDPFLTAGRPESGRSLVRFLAATDLVCCSSLHNGIPIFALATVSTPNITKPKELYKPDCSFKNNAKAFNHNNGVNKDPDAMKVDKIEEAVNALQINDFVKLDTGAAVEIEFPTFAENLPFYVIEKNKDSSLILISVEALMSLKATLNLQKKKMIIPLEGKNHEAGLIQKREN